MKCPLCGYDTGLDNWPSMAWHICARHATLRCPACNHYNVEWSVHLYLHPEKTLDSFAHHLASCAKFKEMQLVAYLTGDYPYQRLVDLMAGIRF